MMSWQVDAFRERITSEVSIFFNLTKMYCKLQCSKDLVLEGRPLTTPLMSCRQKILLLLFSQRSYWNLINFSRSVLCSIHNESWYELPCLIFFFFFFYKMRF